MPKPGDGSCMFHSIAYSTGEDAGELRADLAKFVRENPTRLLSGTPVKDWILWDSGLTPATCGGFDIILARFVIFVYCSSLLSTLHYRAGLESVVMLIFYTLLAYCRF